MFHHSTLLDPLLKNAPNTPVLIHPDGSKLTCGEVLSKSKILAYNLYQQGFRENDIAVITLPAGELFLYIMYAMIILRAKVAIIDPEMGRANFNAKLQQLQPRWAFIDSRILLLNEHPILRSIIFRLHKNIPYFKSPLGCKVISAGKFMPTFKRHKTLKSLLTRIAGPIKLIQNELPHEFIIVYTSGTVQEPKGVIHTFNSLSRSINHLIEIIGHEKNDLIGTDLPQYMLLGISAGIPVIISPSGMSVAKRLHWIEDMRVSILFSPPSEVLPLIENCEQLNRLLPKSVRRILLGSAPVHKSFLKRLKKVTFDEVKTSSLYGMTELLICAIVDSETKINYSTTGDVLGIPWKDVKCKIADDGEIFLSSPQLYSRYFHEHARDDFHATGDMGYVDSNGYLVLTGRKKDMIIRKNLNIYPGIYEFIVRLIDGVDDCAMIGVWNELKEDEDVYLVIESKYLTAEKIKRSLTSGETAIDIQALPDYIILKKLHRGGRQNKIDKKRLRREFEQGNSCEFNFQ
ncbi:MAG: class I adenylate-forming enzyme family protein [Bacteroidota bacterium]